MGNPVLDLAEIDAAVADVHSAFERLVSLIVGQHYQVVGLAACAASTIGNRLVGTVLSALARAEDPYRRERLIDVLESIGVLDSAEAIKLLNRLAEEDPDEDIRFRAMEVCTELEQLEECQDELDELNF